MSETNGQSNPNPLGFAPQDVILQMQQLGSQWLTHAREGFDQWTSSSAQVDAWQRESVERATEVTDELAKLARSGIEYGSKLAEQWRTTSTEMVRRTLDLVTPKA